MTGRTTLPGYNNARVELLRSSISDEEKLAFARAYYAGWEKAAADAGMEKEAILGLIGEGVMRLGRWGMSRAKGLTSAAAKPFEWTGRLGESGLKKVLKPETFKKWMPKIRTSFKGTAKDMAGFGLFSGGLNAAMAEPGERGSAFMSGFVPGALGGLGMGLGTNLTRQGLGRLGVERLAKKELAPGATLGQKAKTTAAKGTMVAAPFVGGTAGMLAAEPSHIQSTFAPAQAGPYTQTWTAPRQSWGMQRQGW